VGDERKQTLAAGKAGIDLKVEWGSRSKAIQAKLKSAKGVSFMLLMPGTGPVTLGEVEDADLGSWDTVTPKNRPITRNGNDTEVKATYGELRGPRGGTPHLNVRLDFSLSVTAGGKSAVVLAFRQLFEMDASNVLTAKECAIDNFVLQASRTGPTLVAPPGFTTPPPRRKFPGLHPLVTLTQTASLATIHVNAEFVDLTLLWWQLHTDANNWYLNPDLPTPGRQTRLRVLGWTSGGDPMIWFVVIPDAAASSIGSGTEDLVFLRPQAGINSFAYRPTEAGLTDSRHDGKDPWTLDERVNSFSTLAVLSRYLLSPIPGDKLASVVAKGTVAHIELLADQVQANGSPPATPDPPDPMDSATRFPVAFRPVGMEQAFNQAGGNRVLLLPLAAGDTPAPYEGAILPDLKTTTHSALGTLWSAGAIDTSGTTVPTFDKRELWLGAHSGGNQSLWTCAKQNAADVGRMIVIDPSPWKDNLGAAGISAITATAKGRTPKTLDVFAVISPNLSQPKHPAKAGPFLGLDDDTDVKLRHTGAAITVLPDFARRESFWNPLPAAAPGSPKSFVQYVLSQWGDGSTSLIAGSPPAGRKSDFIADSATKSPGKWPFLFFHETAMDGGDLVAGASPTASPTVRIFFEQALGAPSPRPP
jgi:hypothetical protein